MKNVFNFLPLCFLLVGAAPQNEIEKQVREAQLAAAKRTQMSNKFSQEAFVAKTKKLKKSNGTLKSVTPDQFRWETLSPSKEVYVSNGKEFWKYVEITKHAQKLKSTSLDLDFLNVLFDLNQLTIRYSVAKWDENSDGIGAPSWPKPVKSDHSVLLALSPKVDKEPKIYLSLEKKRGIVEEMRLAFGNGNVTRIVFTEFKYDKLAASTFEFKPPAGTVVEANSN